MRYAVKAFRPRSDGKGKMCVLGLYEQEVETAHDSQQDKAEDQWIGKGEYLARKAGNEEKCDD